MFNQRLARFCVVRTVIIGSCPPTQASIPSMPFVDWPRLGPVLIVFGVAFSRVWSIPFLAVGLGLLVASCWSRRDGLLLFGPFVGQELRTTIRRDARPSLADTSRPHWAESSSSGRCPFARFSRPPLPCRWPGPSSFSARRTSSRFRFFPSACRGFRPRLPANGKPNDWIFC